MVIKHRRNPDAEFVVWEIREGLAYSKDEAEQRIDELIQRGWWPLSTTTAVDSIGVIYIITLLALPQEAELEVAE